MLEKHNLELKITLNNGSSYLLILKDFSDIDKIVGMNPREQVHFFENIYVPHNATAFNAKELLLDPSLKLKRYK